MSKILNSKIAIDFVRRRLWSHGFKVKTMPEGSVLFDLLVGSGVKLAVVVGKPGSVKDFVEGVDMVAYVVKDKISSTNVIYFEVLGKEGYFQNPKEAMEQVKL